MKSSKIINRIAIYSQSATPLNTDDSKGQPKLIAVGPNKLVIEQYFLKIDKHLILLQTRDIIKAIDYLFKAHYAFHIKYDGVLQNFLNTTLIFTKYLINVLTKLLKHFYKN